MSRLIDANALIKRLEDTSRMPIPAWLRMEIVNAPTIEPERKTGKWIRDAVWFTRYHCSQCGEKTEDTVMSRPRHNFCPNCGADMRGEK